MMRPMAFCKSRERVLIDGRLSCCKTGAMSDFAAAEDPAAAA